MSGAAGIVVDASVALKWVLNEPESAWAHRLAEGSEAMIAPDLLWIECANALWRIARKPRTGLDAPKALRAVCRSPVTLVRPGREAHEEAMRIAQGLDHPAYDCLYLALALDRGAALATADLRFAHALRRAGALSDDRLLTPPAQLP